MSLLDKIYEVDGMRWAGNANELNAAYAADGYSRVKGLACLVTTFGVGELSALNGVGGAYAEHVGMLHVVGVPSISSQAKQLLLHHTLGNGDFTVFHRMSNNISQTTAFLSDINSAPGEIDRCIREAWVHQRPVYVGLPANLVDLTVPASLLDTPIDLSLKKTTLMPRRRSLRPFWTWSTRPRTQSSWSMLVLLDTAAERRFLVWLTLPTSQCS